MKVESITDGNGNDVSSNPNHIANLNPLRYRSYFYDAETGFYWLNTRYYNPEVGRFLNADGALYNGIIRNLFSYCFNNPLNFCDCYGDCAHNPYKTCDPCYRAYLADDVVDEDQYHNRDIPISFEDDSSKIVPFGQTHSLGQGWHYRIDRNASGEHIHIFNDKKSKGTYSQNDDGTPHDKSKNKQTDPPKWIKDLLKKAGWDWDGNKNNKNGGNEGNGANKKTTNVNHMVTLGATIGTGYIIYKVIRLLPSLIPPFWGTIPLNIATP